MPIEIQTPYGSKYRVATPSGYITRLDIPGFKPSGHWKVLALVSLRPRFMVPLSDITEEWLAAHPLHFKNGKPRYTIRDLDHGTVREWGNTEHHGVGSIRIVGEA